MEKKEEVDSLLSSLQTKQKELEGDESLLERDKPVAALKEEATLKVTLEEKDQVTSLSCSLSVHSLSTVFTTLIQFQQQFPVFCVHTACQVLNSPTKLHPPVKSSVFCSFESVCILYFISTNFEPLVYVQVT